MTDRLERVIESFRAGEERGLARAISAVEDERPGFEALLDELHEGVGRARRIGVTGPPGAGKSTLTAALARRYRDEGLRVGVLAVDPTSPFSGGALLGDRIRMSELATEEGIFIRSMANRGSAGGLAAASREAVDLMDAFGFDRVIVETVGVGQSELAVAGSADSTVVVLVPESGDGVQAMKAGLMEVADVFVVNKADRQGAARLRKEIEVVKRLRSKRGPWDPPVLETVASRAEGVDALRDALDEHFAHLEASGELGSRRREHLLEQVRAVLQRRALRRVEALWMEGAEEYAEELVQGDTTPYAVADRLGEREGAGER